MNLIKTLRTLALALRGETFPIIGVTVTGPNVPFANCSEVQAAGQCEKYLLALANKNLRLGMAISNHYIALFPIDENRQVIGPAMTMHAGTSEIEGLAGYITSLLKYPRISPINR